MARKLTREERILARHWLQVLSEQAKDVRNAMDPNYGRLAITDQVWAEQWDSLKCELDKFTTDVLAGRLPTALNPRGLGDRNA